jgi:hypothetical protein
MIELAPRNTGPLARISGQPIAVAAVALSLVLIGIGSIALWRSYTGATPETDRVVATRQLQARTAQASEQLVEKTKGLEATQQESIDRHQKAFRAGRQPDRGHRRAAAIVRERAGGRAGGSAHLPQAVGAESPRRQQRQPQARQVARLTAARRFSAPIVNYLTYGPTNPSHAAIHRMA